MEVLSPRTLASWEEEIKESIGQPRYELWFNGNTKVELDDGALKIGVPNRFYREWLENHFQDAIRQACSKVFGEVLPIRFHIDPGLFRAGARGRADEAPRKSSPSKSRTAAAAAAAPRRPSRYGLATFIVGPSNRMAHAAAMSLLDDPKGGYSPLLIHGAGGLGKTHLLKGMEEALRFRHPDVKALSLSCEEFTNQFVEAMRTGKINAFRRRFRQLEVLLVDDVQFLAGKRGTQEEFFHTYNALAARNAKMVFACDVHPRRLEKIGEELRSRFLSGIVARLEPINREMRRQILRAKAAQRRFELSNEVLDFLTDNLCANVAELEGALNYLEHYCETLSAPLDLATTQTALGEILRHSVPVLRIDEVRKRACALLEISPTCLTDRARSRAVTHPRMLLLYLCRRYTKSTYAEIGRQFGGLNHSTVISAEKKIRDLINRDGEMVLGDRAWKVRDAIEAFERELGSSG